MPNVKSGWLSMGSFNFPQVDLNNATAVAVWYETHDIPQRYNAAIVVASLLVAVLGAYSTLIVLGKRTSNAGVRNALLLVWAAMTMSCVGIWGMHFIGMNFRLEPVPGQSWYISFSAAFTVFSLIVPFVALVLAFVFVDYFTLRPWRIAVSGILTGCIVGLMHYSASMKCNFHVSYAPAQTVVSIVLACICAIVALTLFFRLRAQWQDSWQRRLLCSFILAMGVSGMHYIGSWGTSYRMRPSRVYDLEKLKNGRHSNMTVVIIVAVMCFVIVVASTFMSVSDVLSARETRKKARKIVLASASFDHMGRLLVQADGSLPLVVLEENVLRHTEVLDALDSRSEIFQWLFAVSWAWNIVVPFLDAIAKRVGQRPDQATDHSSCREGEQRSRSWHARLARKLGVDALSRRERRDERQANIQAAAGATSYNAGIAQSFRNLALYDFRDRVVEAAHRLADQLEVPLEDVGVFYDHNLPTGTQKHAGPRASLARHQQQLFSLRERRKQGALIVPTGTQQDDEEASISTSRAPSIFADGEDEEEGVTIFLVRETAPAHQTLLAKRGYRFTETRFLANVLADRHSVSKSDMDELLDGLRLYAKRGTRPVVQPSGVYVGLFGVRPSMSARQGGLDVLVYNFARHQIPAFRLPDIVTVTHEMRTFLKLLDQMPVDQALRVCERESIRTAERNKAIARLLLDQAQAQLVGDGRSVETGNTSTDTTRTPASQMNSADAEEKARHAGLASEENLRQVLDLQTQEASLQAFQIALYTALEALMQSVRVFPRLNSTARISADILQVPSSLDDAKPPAHVILVQAVLPMDKTPNMRSSTSTLGGLMSHSAATGLGTAVAPSHSLVTPTEHPQAGTPFVFTPYTLFTKAQMMLLRGRTAQAFGVEVQESFGRRYNVDPTSFLGTGSEKGKRLSRSDPDYNDFFSRDDVLSTKTGEGKSVFENDDEQDREDKDDTSGKRSAIKRWIAQLSMSNGSKHDDSRVSKRKISKQTIGSMPQSDPTFLQDSIDQSISGTQPSPTDTKLAHTSPSRSSSVHGMAATLSHQTGSLGIRRFTGQDGSQSDLPSLADQSRFARSTEEVDYNLPLAQETGVRRAPSNGQASRKVLQPATPRRRSSTADQQLPQQLPASAQIISSLASRPRSRTLGSGQQNTQLNDAILRRPSTSQVVTVDEESRTQYRPSHKGPAVECNATNPGSSRPFMSAQGLPRRPHTAQAVARPTTASTVAMTGLGVECATTTGGNGSAPADPDSVQARRQLDNWQLRQLRDLERFQPNLLLGVLPTEY